MQRCEKQNSIPKILLQHGAAMSRFRQRKERQMREIYKKASQLKRSGEMSAADFETLATMNITKPGLVKRLLDKRSKQ